MHSIALLGWLGAALSIALPWPQVWRSVVRGRTTGLSATACWQGAAMPVGWITYGLLTGETVQVVTNTVTGLAGLAVLVMVLVKQGELRTRRSLTISAGGAAAVLTAAAVSATTGLLTGVGSARAAGCLGAVLACTAILGAIPQPLSLLRDREQDLAGLSPARWWLAAGACSSWSGYGLATGQPAVWLSALVGLGSALIVCWVLVADRRARTVVATPVIRPAHTPARVVRPVTTHPAPPATNRPAHPATTRPTHPATARPAHSATARPAHPVGARVVQQASTAARPVFGTARIAHPASVRRARGVARVPRPADRPTLIMSRELTPA
jgi:uncharacterized protein with PQ loop repeat